MANSTKLYGLIGERLKHSFSKDYFNQKFISEGIDAQYINFELEDINQLMELISEYPNLDGLNVTLPYKEQIISFLDEIDPVAAEIGAVNVVKFYKDHTGNIIKLRGFNSDAIAFEQSLSPYLQPEHRHALILGSGGASKAVQYALKQLNITFDIVSRTKTSHTLAYEELTRAVLNNAKIIINTTPLGMYPNVNTYPELPYKAIKQDHICYDLIYNPDETQFLKKAKLQGATTINGLQMLLLQAFKSYEIWKS